MSPLWRVVAAPRIRLGAALQTTVAFLASRRGDDQTSIITFTIAVGASLWLNDHGCACGDHAPDPDLFGSLAEPDVRSCDSPRPRWYRRFRWLPRR